MDPNGCKWSSWNFPGTGTYLSGACRPLAVAFSGEMIGAFKCPLKFGVIRGKSNHDGGGASLSAADSSSRFMSSQSRMSFLKVLFAIISCVSFPKMWDKANRKGG